MITLAHVMSATAVVLGGLGRTVAVAGSTDHGKDRETALTAHLEQPFAVRCVVAIASNGAVVVIVTDEYGPLYSLQSGDSGP